MNIASNTSEISFAPVLNQGDAIKVFNPKKGLFPSRKTMVKTECIFVPIYIFKIETEDKCKNSVSHEVCVDAIEGQFALIQTKDLKTTINDSSSASEFLIPEEVAKQKAYFEFSLHLQRFKPGVSIKDINLETISYYPYWIGFFESKKGYSFEVIDGCSGKVQGVKMQSLFSKLILKRSNH
jgi:hypothetical protein